jgi:hypothetical protein
MAKLQGPLLSHAASGMLGGVIAYAAGTQLPLASARRRPAVGTAGAQRAQRLVFSALCQAWKNMDQATRDGWATAPRSGNGSNQAAFLARGLQSWAHGQAPLNIWPAPPPDPQGAADINQLDPIRGGFVIAIDISAAEWFGINFIYASENNLFEPSPDTLIDVRQNWPDANQQFTVIHVPVGTWWVRARYASGNAVWTDTSPPYMVNVSEAPKLKKRLAT